MSGSRKKHNMGGITTAESEKSDKQLWHRIFRRKNKILLNNAGSDETVFVDIKEASDPWLMAKDGKTIYSSEKDKRK